jgi:cold shock CspA family protein
MIEAPHRHQQHGQTYHVRIDLSVPGHELVVSRDPSGKQGGHERLDVAIRDAFRTLRRQLQDWIARTRGEVKTHEAPPQGRVARIFADDGYGFIEAADGREIYFHENAVLNGDFAQLEVGTAVAFAEEQGDEGPQASTVRVQV